VPQLYLVAVLCQHLLMKTLLKYLALVVMVVRHLPQLLAALPSQHLLLTALLHQLLALAVVVPHLALTVLLNQYQTNLLLVLVELAHS